MATKYQVTELDKALQQFKGIDEWTNEQQLRHRLQIKEKTIDKLNEEIEELKQAIHLYHDELEQLKKREETHKHIVPNLEAWRDRHAVTIQILEKSMSKKEEEIEELKQAIHLYDDELTHYRKLKSALFPLIERLWAIDSGDRFALIKGEKKEIINTIAYRIANEWID
jgi:predicted RNase H-like nuclease (RuvC/YqgF family)